MDCEFISSEENFVADALTRAGTMLINDLPTTLDYEAVADAQTNDTEIKAMTQQISSLRLQHLPISKNITILCDVSH